MHSLRMQRVAPLSRAQRPANTGVRPAELATDPIRAIFELLDRDRDGYLSRAEYKSFCLRTESKDLDDARWSLHCGPDGLRVANAARGIALDEFRQLFSSRCCQLFRQLFS